MALSFVSMLVFISVMGLKIVYEWGFLPTIVSVVLAIVYGSFVWKVIVKR